MNRTIPELSLVVLVGPSGACKSTFARAHFKPTEILSSDFCRGLVADDDPEANPTGVKGLGEIGIIGVNAAIANALYAATGRRIRRLPIRVEDLI